MKALRRAATLTLTVALTTALIAACGTDPDGPNASSNGQITLKIWDFSAEQVDFHKAVAAEYHKSNPKVKIEWRSITQDEYAKTLPLAFQSKQAPDIFYWSDGGPMNMGQLLTQQWIKPLHPSGKPPEDFLKRWPAGSFIEGINQSDGKTYGFPFSENLYWGPGYMYLNKQVFQEAGLDTNNPPKTWSELKAACAKVKASTKSECIASPSKGRELQRIYFALASGVRSDLFFDLKTGKFALDDAPALKTFEFIQDLNNNGYLAPGTNDKNFSRQQFAANQAAIYFDGTWMPSVWKSQGFSNDKYAVAPHPNPDAGATGALSRQQDGNKYWISSQTPNHQQAWDFLNWMTDPEGYFVKEYYNQGFGTLAFTDNKKMVTDPAIQQIMKIAETPGFRVNVPVPVLKCPDIAKSKAYLEATGKRPSGEYEAMVEALVGKKPLAPLASALVQERQTTFENKLKEEAAAGLKVSKDCYTFPDWDYTADFGLDKYKR
ncbi:extracellular solute-binding protein [Kribbella sp. NBC_01245]|uniref:ABC transporter substrate-binding protein n=1 Tax=Kribbella sp. NBC_01245 TaxID=2903578 RepID=UPI002E2B7BFD|nr:extracellular solute-binding protein [Kribbella sp. NBC_01245]